MSKPKTPKVIVVGAGLGGLAAATSLAMKGYRVEIFERNDRIGGKLNVLREGGFSFDLGPSIFTLPHMFRPLFEQNGRRLEDYIKLVRVDPQWRNFFEDGTTVDLWEREADMERELERLGPHAFAEYREMLRYSKAQYDITERGYFAKGLDTFWDFVKFYGWRDGRGFDFWHSMRGGIAKRTRDPYLQAIFEYFIKYVGASANDAPGFMNLMPNIQLEFGLWYIQGGLYELAHAFETRLSELGVTVHLNAEVESITRQGDRVTGIRSRIERGPSRDFEADYVVSNMEVLPAYRELLGESDGFMRKLEKFEPACSGIVLHLGLNRTYPQLAHHNFFYSKDQHRHFDRVFREGKLPDDPTIYLVAPTRTDPSQAPEGHDNIKILPHIPYLNGKYTREDCLALKERVLDKLERMGLEGLRKHTVVEDFWTPFDIEKRYRSNGGSIYGVVSDRFKNFAFKAPKRSNKYRNLFFAGGSVNPGGGMPMVVLCGRHVADLIDRDERGSRS
ncbi:MAG TPA: phytoene desaturase family protein [Bdellovibrionota bacterium]|jgi:diapolycopene oxygenase|nr:phytoene desaturase family protein [Bdellovibrionota bacterium]